MDLSGRRPGAEGVIFQTSRDRYEGATLKHRGRPKAAVAIELVMLRLDAVVQAALRASGEG